MKQLLLLSITLVGLTMCHYAPAKPYDVVAQTTQIITPDGKMVTCI